MLDGREATMRSVAPVPIVLLTAVVSLSTIGIPALAADPLYERAVASFRSADYEQAARLFEELIERSPSWADGHLSLGHCYYLLGEPGKGHESIRVAAEWDPEVDRFKAYFGTGETLYRQRRFEEAVAPLERALEHAPGPEGDDRRKSATFRLAQTYLLVDRPLDARPLLERYVDLYGIDFRSAYNLGLACRKLGDDRCALTNMRLAATTSSEENPSYRKAQEYLARWSHSWALRAEAPEIRDTERLSDAIDATRTWYEAEPGDPRAVECYAETLLVAGRGEDVVRELRPAATRAGSCAARLLTARALNSLGNCSEAETWARAAVLCDPTLADAHVELAAAHIHSVRPEPTGLDEVRIAEKRMTQVVDSLRQALAVEPGHRRAATMLMEAEVTLERLGQVAGDLVAALRADELENTRQRCLRLLWTRQRESRELTPEEESFFRQADCRQHDR
jgi:tetratricopeptide (TPR) repeat protein